MTFWRTETDGVTVTVKVHPRSRRPGLHGVGVSASGLRLKIAVSEAAKDGKANAAACSILAKALGGPASSVRVVAGAANREKLLLVTGDTAALIGKLSLL
jgi:uncharacterized protein YggU (UPF0235/DUF167 family)